MKSRLTECVDSILDWKIIHFQDSKESELVVALMFRFSFFPEKTTGCTKFSI